MEDACVEKTIMEIFEADLWHAWGFGRKSVVKDGECEIITPHGVHECSWGDDFLCIVGGELMFRSERDGTERCEGDVARFEVCQSEQLRDTAWDVGVECLWKGHFISVV